MKKHRIQRSREDLQRELIEQLQLLRRACVDFDTGFEPVGKHIALSLRVLIHQHGNSRALLEQLGLRSGRFLDTAGPLNPRNLVGEHNLVAMQMGPSGGRYVTLVSTGGFAERERMINFVDWWNEPVLKDGQGRVFSRRDLISSVADTDGGAHVDPDLDEAYMALSRRNSLGWTFESGNATQPFGGRPELACVRQIAHELLCTLRKGGSAFASHADPVLPSAIDASEQPSMTVQFVSMEKGGEPEPHDA